MATTVGSWKINEDASIPAEASAAFEEALAGLMGAYYTPLFCIATQLVNGLNYLFIAKKSIPGRADEAIAAIIVNKPASGDGATIVGEIQEIV